MSAFFSGLLNPLTIPAHLLALLALGLLISQQRATLPPSLGFATALAAGLTAILRRDRTWPSRVGAITSGLTVAALIVVLLDVEAQASHNVTDGDISTDITIGAGAWVVLLVTVLAVIAALISLTQERGPSR